MSKYINVKSLKHWLVEQIKLKTIDFITAAHIACFVDNFSTTDVQEVKHGKWIVRHRHEHYPSGKAYDENVCPFCKRADHNGDGCFCGYCGAKMDGKNQYRNGAK